MQEIELKFQVPAACREAVAREVAGRQPPPALRLQAAYFDTADRRLAQAGLALRLRREGTIWVQTLKGAASDGLTRLEHNAPRPGRSAKVPALDLSLHDATPAGKRLAEVLSTDGAAELHCLFRTDIRRQVRRVRTRLGSVELAFDQGHVLAGDARSPVCELEIELVSGSPLAVMATARRWIDRHGLWLDTRSKAERGDLLARGISRAPEREARAVRLKPNMELAAARRSVLASCLDQVSVNASQVAAGDFSSEHVHQLRIGLRRLRTALRLFDEVVPAAELATTAEAWFRQLGTARDQAAMALLRQALQHALQSLGLDLEAPRLPVPTDGGDPMLVSRSAPAQHLLLDLLTAVQAPPESTDAGATTTHDDPTARHDLDRRKLRDLLARRLNRWHREVARDVARFEALDDAQRHALRKHAKRLRYAAEFAGALFPGRAVKRYLRSLRRLQSLLGELNDVAVAIEGHRRLPAAMAPLFALGWLAAHRESLLAGSGPVLASFAKTRRFWR